MADNCEMGHDEAPSGDDAQGSEQRPSASDPTDHGLEVREPYLRRVLAEFEAGRLEAYEYTRRVLAINATSSTTEMETIVGQSAQDAPHIGAGAGLAKSLDAVDLARMRSEASSRPSGPTARYIALGIVFVMFAVLIGLGMWLATHVHGAALHAHATLSGVPALGLTPWR
jgi:hypothetical protein